MFSHLLEEKDSNIFEQSCVPASMAILFASLLIKNNKTNDLYSKVKHIFELSVYPELWGTQGGLANNNKAYSFFTTFLKYKNIQKINQKEVVEEQKASQDYVLFAITSKHVSLIFPANDHFIDADFPHVKLDRLQPLSDDASAYFAKIAISDLDIDKISDYYEKYKKEISSLLQKKYFGSFRVEKWLFVPVDVLHEVAPEVLQEKFEKFIMRYSWPNIERICALFPEKKSIVKEIIFRNLGNTIKQTSDLVYILGGCVYPGSPKTPGLFPEERAIISQHILKHPLTFAFGEEYDYIAENHRETKNELDALIFNIILNHPKELITSVTNVYLLIARYAGDQKLAIEAFVLKNLNMLFKKSWEIYDVQRLIDIFPHKNEDILHFVMQNLSHFTKADKFGSRDYKIKRLCEIFPEINISSEGSKRISIFGGHNKETKEKSASFSTLPPKSSSK